MRATKFALAALVFVVLPGFAWAADLSVSLVQLSTPVAASSDATIGVRTAVGAPCRITVSYKSGPSRAKGLEPKVADGIGLVRWRWRVGSNTTPGRWPIVVTCERGGDRGELSATFEVR